MKLVKSLIVAVIVFLGTVVNAQLPDQGEARLLYRKEFVGGLMIHTSGWGFNLRYGKQITNLRKLSIGLDFTNLRHPNEKKTNPSFDNGKGYYFGKLNSLLVLRPTVGVRQILFPKKRPQGVEIGYNLAFGPSIGFVKPVYLEIIYPLADGSATLTEERFDANKHTTDNIYGRAKFSKGLNELSINPGIYSKFGLHFEHSPEEDGIKALEVGIMADYYIKEVPLMAITKNYHLYLNFYISILFGRKYF